MKQYIRFTATDGLYHRKVLLTFCSCNVHGAARKIFISAAIMYVQLKTFLFPLANNWWLISSSSHSDQSFTGLESLPVCSLEETEYITRNIGNPYTIKVLLHLAEFELHLRNKKDVQKNLKQYFGKPFNVNIACKVIREGSGCFTAKCLQRHGVMYDRFR